MAFKMVIEFNNLPGVGDGVRKACQDVVRKAATDVLADALIRVPVDTGHLKSTGRTGMIGPLTAEVVFSAEYAAYVELGTYKMAAQPYLTPAVDQIRGPFLQAVGAVVRRELEGR